MEVTDYIKLFVEYLTKLFEIIASFLKKDETTTPAEPA